MRRTEVLQGVRMMKFRDVLGRRGEGGLSQLEAASACLSRGDGADSDRRRQELQSWISRPPAA